MTGRELDRRFVEHMRALQLASERDGDESSSTYFAALVEELSRAILARGCTRGDVLVFARAMTTAPNRVDPWVEFHDLPTRPGTPRALKKWWQRWL